MSLGRSLIVGVLSICVGLAAAQKSEVDTMRIITSNGLPGDTVAVPIQLSNRFEVSAISLRVVYDTNVIEPLRIETEGTRLAGIYNKFGSRADPIQGWMYWFGLNFEDPDENYIPEGSGVIAYFVCRIKPGTPLGVQARISLEDGAGNGELNALSDRTGHMVLPVLDGGVLQVRAMAVEDDTGPPSVPARFSVGVQPNPLSNETIVHYAVPGSVGQRTSDVSFRIYDINGRLVRNLVTESKEPGYYMVPWDAKDDAGEELSSGVYFLRAQVDETHRRISKLIVVK